MENRPNILWLMSDQHNANCTGYRSHPNVRTPNLDRIAETGLDFVNAYANCPICSPSRISFMNGQYVHTHGMYGNKNSMYSEPNNQTLAFQFRKYGYQTALFGKSHMVRKWDYDAFERIRYTDLIDAKPGMPESCHYFNFLKEKGLSDYYEEGSPKPGQEYTLDGSEPASLPYKYSIEKFTGDETLKFLNERDKNRPFFIKMSFQRPHAPITPAEEHFNMYDPEEIVLPDNAYDLYENKFASKPEFMQKKLRDGCQYPLATPDKERLKRCLASYYSLISVIDKEIGRVLDKLEELDELENTIIIYTADHGDFAGEHGLFHKNFGIYDSIQKIPFLLKWPGGPQGEKCQDLIESVDLYPTLCQLCDIPLPEGREGISLVDLYQGKVEKKEAVYCELDNYYNEGKISAIRTDRYRLVYYNERKTGELYDHNNDSGEINNLWDDPKYKDIKIELLQELLSFTSKHRDVTSIEHDRKLAEEQKYMPTPLLQFRGTYWSQLEEAYHNKLSWPPE